jgi:hypothetical protein
MYPADPVNFPKMSSQLLVFFVMITLPHQIEIKIREHGGKGVRVYEL